MEAEGQRESMARSMPPESSISCTFLLATRTSPVAQQCWGTWELVCAGVYMLGEGRLPC